MKRSLLTRLTAFLLLLAVSVSQAQSMFILKNGILTIDQDAYRQNGSPSTLYVPEYISSPGDISTINICGIDISRLVLPEIPFDLILGSCPKLSEVSWGGITSISQIDNCPSLKQIVFPESLKQLAEQTFYGNPDIEVVKLPDAVTVIPENCFSFCKNLTQVSFSNVEEIGNYAFEECTALCDVGMGWSFQLPFQTKKIGKFAFAGCKSLVSKWGGELYLNTPVIDDLAFAETGAVKVIFTGNVEYANMSVIGYNPDLQSVLFRPSDKPLHITPGAIWATSQGPKPETPVPSIEIGREFTNEDGTGRGYLGELKGVEYVFAATETFYNPILGSDNDYVIIINYNVKHLCDCIAREYKFGWQTGAGIYADQLESIENVSYTNNIGPEKLDLTPFTRLTKISNSFDSNVPYKKIVIPGNVTDVYNCFSNYEREAGVTIDTLEVFPGESPVDLYSSFGDRGYVNHLNLHRTSNFLSYPVKNLTVFGEVKSFYYNGCDILEEAEFKDGVETISSLSGHPVLRKITLPSTLKEIGTFYDCPKLTELTLPEGLEKIGDYAFKGTGIHNLSIPNSVTALDDMTLSGMEFLNDVSFGKDLTSISWFNWEACPSLRVIRCASLKPAALTQSDNPENFYDDAFYKSVSVACPTAAYQAYSEAMGWRKFFYGKKSISLTTNYKSEYVVYFRNYMKFRSSAASPENLIPVADASTMGLGEGEPVTLVFKIPENASLKKVTLNDKDITSQIVDGEYTIARLDADSRLDVEIADSASGIDNITQDGEYTDGLFDVYSLSGTCLMRKADRQAVEALYPGIYIINGKKVIIRK